MLWNWLPALRQVPGCCCSPWRCRGSFFAKTPWRQIGTVLVIVNAAPIASNIAVYAQRLGLDSSYAVQMVCLSTLLSLITLPVMLSLAAALGFA